MMQQASHFLLSVIFLQVVFSTTSLVNESIPSNHTACAPTLYTCGYSTFQISYPFQLADRPDYCGSPGYNVKCTTNNDNSSTLTITISNNTYQIISFDYLNRLLNLVGFDFDIDFNYLNGYCPLPYPTPTIDTALFDYSDRDRNLTLFINCTTPTSPIPTIVNTGCDFGLQGQYSYYRLTNGSMDDVLRGCTSTVVVPIAAEAAENLSKGTLGFSQVLQVGFYVNWVAGRDWCGDCESSGGYCGSRNGTSSMDDRICFCVNGTSSTGSCTSNDQGKSGVKIKIIIGICVGLASLLMGSFVFVLCFRSHGTTCRIPFQKQKNAKHARSIEAFLEKYGSLAAKRYTYSDVKRMTESFREKLGQGGYGSVYKGKLSDGRQVAVKVLSETKGNGEEFMNEVATIGNTSHVNVVSLRGFCAEGSKRALIYDFMPNGSLEKYISWGKLEAETSNSLGWEKLYEIAVGIARGLDYLHRGCNTRIVHFDIKPHNILLDQDFCPKISDFGMAKLCRPKQSIVSSCGTRGTVGYIAPEVFFRTFGVISSKSDVYSYGMMVLDMFGAKSSISTRGVDSTSEAYFPRSIYRHIVNNNSLLEYGVTSETEDIGKKMMIVGFWCIQTMPDNRPSMTTVVDMLKESVDDLPIPPEPLLSSPLDLIAGNNSTEEIGISKASRSHFRDLKRRLDLRHFLEHPTSMLEMEEVQNHERGQE